jgi:group I intron endonuclease
MQGVYWWRNTVNGKAYIESARNIARRKTAHLRALKANKHHSIHFQHAWNVYGPEVFEFEVLEEIKDEIWLRARETAWLSQLQTFKSENGYNICKDGWSAVQYEPTERRKEAWKRNGELKRGTKDSPEVKARKKAASKLRAQTDKFKADIILRRVGKKHSVKDRSNLRKAWIARKARGDYYKFTFEDTLKGVTAAGAKNKLLWQDPQYRANQSQKMKASWTPERRAAQAERARKQPLANPINQRKTEQERRNVVEVHDE